MYIYQFRLWVFSNRYGITIVGVMQMEIETVFLLAHIQLPKTDNVFNFE
jgi:hypothetical protein